MFQDNRDIEDILREVKNESSLSIDFIVLTILSAVIASFGLLLNSTAVVIGAMILAPLMTPILGVSFSGLIYRRDLLIRSLFLITTGIVLACITAGIIGFLFSTVGVTPEILARTKPNIMDLFIALCAGFLGGYVKVRKPLAGSIPGVAIAISLMPPLCVTGIGLAYGLPNIFIGSALLFFTNFISIVFSGLIAFWLLDFKYLEKNHKAFLWPAVLSLLLVAPLGFNFQSMIEEGKVKREVNYLLRSKTYTFQTIDIAKIEVDMFQNPVLITVTANVAQPNISKRQVHLVKEYLSRKIGKPVSLVINFNPVIQVADMESLPS